MKQDFEDYEANLKLHTEETIPFYFKKFDDIVKANKGHLALGRLTWADIYFQTTLEFLNYVTKVELTADYPYLKKLVEGVMATEKISEWIEKRPLTEY